MSATNSDQRIEYPDATGYPDGAGFLDEGTVTLIDEATAGTVREVDRPSADTDAEIMVRHHVDERVYAATIDGRQIASFRYDLVDGRIIVLTTTVPPSSAGAASLQTSSPMRSMTSANEGCT